jgi:multidrug efflux pump subunit AcrA (membrane-fusion protein)
MRIALVAALMVAGSVIAQDDPFLRGEELKATVERDCSEGCITFNRQEAQALQEQLELLIAQREKEAFAAGVNHQKAACRSLI